MLKYNGTEVARVFFDGLDIDIVNINGVKVFEAVRKREYDPILMTKTVTPYGEDVVMDIIDIQEGGHIDASNVTSSGIIPISNISISGNRLSFKASTCDKGVTGKIQIPVVECDEYFDYLIPIELDSCTHPSSKLTYHSGSAASCTGSGVSAYYTCSCDTANHTLNGSGNEISTYIAPLGHNSSSSSTESSHLKSAATCTSPAYYYYSCSRCGTNSSSSFSSGSALGHNFNTSGKIWSESRQLRKSATCGEYTSYWCECSRCTVHSTTEWFYDTSSTKPPHTNTSSGYSSYYCTVCGTTGSNLISTSSPAKYQGGITVSGSSLSSTDAWGQCAWTFATTVGEQYTIKYNITNISSPGCQVFILTDYSGSGSNLYYKSDWVQSGSLSNTITFTANASICYFKIFSNNSSTVTNASCNFQMLAYPVG